MPYTTKLLNFKTKVHNMARTHQTPRRSAAAAQSGYYGKNPRRFRPGTVALREIR